MLKAKGHLGLKKGMVEVVPYDPLWPQLFEKEKLQLRRVLGNRVYEIEHIGSTSVPELAAKPLIDMIASVDSLDVYRELIAPLKQLGYEFMPERVFDDRIFFPKGPRENRTHHLNFVVKDSEGWKNPLALRDYLRNDPIGRSEYQNVKRMLAKQYAEDRSAYTKAKSAFIEKYLKSKRL